MEGNKGIGRQFLGCEVIITLVASSLQAAIAGSGSGLTGKVVDYDDNFVYIRSTGQHRFKCAVNIRNIDTIMEYTEEMKQEDERESIDEEGEFILGELKIKEVKN